MIYYKRYSLANEEAIKTGKKVFAKEIVKEKGLSSKMNPFKFFLADYNEIEQIVENTPDIFRLYNECIDGPQKIYFDIDGRSICNAGEINPDDSGAAVSNGLDPNVMNKDIYSITLPIIIDTFEYLFGIKINADNVIYLTSSNNTKISMHIIIDGYFVKDSNTNKIFCTEVMRRSEGRQSAWQIDNGIYTKHRLIRMKHCQKYLTNRVLVEFEPKNCEYLKTCICYTQDSKPVTLLVQDRCNNI